MPNLIYVKPETTATFKSTGGTAVFTPTSLGNNAGRVSAQWDRGTTSRPGEFQWRAKTKVAVAPAIGAIIRVYLVTSDGTIADAELGTTDAALPTADRLRNLGPPIGVIVADEASTTRFFQASGGPIWLPDRYVQVVWFNEMGQALSATAGDHEMILAPFPAEVQ